MLQFLILLIQITFQKQKCRPSGIHITLGDYFSYNSDVYYNINFMMNRNCKKKIFLKYFETIEDFNLLKNPLIRKYDVKGKFYKENLNYHRDFYFFQLEDLKTPYSFQYQLQDENQNILSGPFTFNFNFDKNELKIVSFGDHDFEKGQLTYEALLQEDYDLLILLGDYSYNIQDNNGRHGDQYLEKWEYLFTSKPVILICGNHEDIDDYQMFNSRLKNPGTISPQDNNYFHFRLKNTLFLSINFDIYYLEKDKSEILENLQNKIDLYKKQKISHKILLTHRPIYGQALENKDMIEFQLNPFLLSEIEEFLIKNKFDFILSAHQHSYQRGKKIQKFEFKGNLIQIIAGTGSSKHKFLNIDQPQLEITQYRKYAQKGYLILLLQNKEYQFQFKGIFDKNYMIFDQFQSLNYGKAQNNLYIIILLLLLLFLIITILRITQQNKLQKKQKMIKEVQMTINNAFKKDNNSYQTH